MPGRYTTNEDFTPLSRIAFAIGSAVDAMSPAIVDAFEPEPTAYPPDIRGLLGCVQLNFQVFLPHNGRPPVRFDVPMVMVEYGLAVLKAQIDGYVEGLPADVQTRFTAAYDQELRSRRDYYQGSGEAK